MTGTTGAATSWVDIPDGSAFPATHLPYGVFRLGDDDPRVGVAIGEQVLDVAAVAAIEGLDGAHVFAEPTLDAFLALGRPAWRAVRSWLLELVTHPANEGLVSPHLIPQSQVTMLLPFTVADYVDFYSSEDHATNVGRIFRPDSEPLTPNWKHLPIGYHGRAGTVVPSGTPIARPAGQRRGAGDDAPTFGPSIRLDIEAEVGFVVGTPSTLGSPVAAGAFAEHVFGVVLVNDWSARDIQAWEYVPLGPFLGKSFATSISTWVTPLDALESARTSTPPRDPQPLPYLQGGDDWGLDLDLEIELNGAVVSRPPFAGMYWSPAQQLAHLTVNGASLRTGDLYASGTVSGPGRDERGSLLELTWNGRDPLTLPSGQQRGFLEDGDEVVLRAWAPAADGGRLGLGEVRGRILPTAQ
ncbi:MAG: fumarylacetoacetase [Actinomycetes bacterium]